ncbi:MAG: DUF2867 domain-containing protein [Candidatus Thorarchaeota archaeon]|nr:MAG: DUF2867 domain-containing protein [Candidatus Thorarchaeota archaeon]
MSSRERVLVLGSTGYVGTRLVTSLLREGYAVRASYRTPEKLGSRPWVGNPSVDFVRTDVLDHSSLKKACVDCSAVFYLVHSMYAGRNFAETDRFAAQNMVEVAEEADLRRIIFLGGLGEEKAKLSKHLRSRAEVSRILHQGSVPTTTLRAAMILGAGSVSFEIMRYLVERLPAMITPKWVRTKSQPISISNVLRYLVGVLKRPDTADCVYDIGGPEVVTYLDLMKLYAQEARLTKRLVVPLPILTPRLSSYWISLITPISSSIARPLVDGLKNEAICQNDEIRKIVPQTLLSNREAIRLSIRQIGQELAGTAKRIGSPQSPPEWMQTGDPEWARGIFHVQMRKSIDASSAQIWNILVRVLGSRGWRYGSILWPLRGYLDEVMGGPGMRNSSTEASQLLPGSTIDCWRVVKASPETYLQLYSRMKSPSRIALDLILKQTEQHRTELTLRIRYAPHGLPGFFMWYTFNPIRRYLLESMMSAIVAQLRNAQEE